MIVRDFTGGTFLQTFAKSETLQKVAFERKVAGERPRISHAGSAMHAPELSAAFFKSPACKMRLSPSAMATNRQPRAGPALTTKPTPFHRKDLIRASRFSPALLFTNDSRGVQ